MFDSVRTRLALWYVGVLALVLIVFSVGVYLLLARELYFKLDADLKTSVEGAARLLDRERTEGESEQQAATSVIEEMASPRQSLAVLDGAGNTLAKKNEAQLAFVPLPDVSLLTTETVQFVTLSNGKTKHRAAMQRITTHGSGYVIVISQSLATLSEQLRQLRDIFLIVIPAALLLAGIGGNLLARRSLAPVVAMAEQARQISGQNLSTRLPVANSQDELGRLATTFNEMLERLETSFDQQRQFMADASHELRTPLHVIRTADEVTLGQAHRTESEYRDALVMIGEQTRRLTRIVEDMFTLARADAGHRELTPTDFYLDELVAETARVAEVLAKHKNIQIAAQQDGEALYRGDEGLLRQMLLNLLDNAIRHTPGGGQVMITLAQKQTSFEIQVSDTGSGIPPDAQPHIFERFFRVDKARSRSDSPNGSGAGLGLSIARWIAEAHKGHLALKRSDTSGTNFTVTLPLNQT